MLDSILEAITQLKIFTLVSAIGIVVTGVVLLFICKDFYWESPNRKHIGFFYRMSTWDTFGLSCCFIKFFLVISFLITGCNVENIHIFIFVVLKLCYIIHRRSLKGIIMDIGLAILSVIVMIIMGLLYNYLHDIMFDFKICIIMWILAVLLCLYALYDLFSCCNYIIRKRDLKNERSKKDK